MVKKVSNCQHHIAHMLHDACLQHVIDILHGLEGVHNHAEASNVELNQRLLVAFSTTIWL